MRWSVGRWRVKRFETRDLPRDPRDLLGDRPQLVAKRYRVAIGGGHASGQAILLLQQLRVPRARGHGSRLGRREVGMRLPAQPRDFGLGSLGLDLCLEQVAKRRDAAERRNERVEAALVEPTLEAVPEQRAGRLPLANAAEHRLGEADALGRQVDRKQLAGPLLMRGNRCGESRRSPPD